MPSDIGLIIFVFIMAMAILLTYHEKRKQNLGPKLKIIHKKGETGFYHKTYDSLLMRYDLHRISIKNLSSKEYAKEVEVEITDIEPENTYIYNEFPIRLHFKDDKEEPFKQQQNINPGKSIFVNVLCMKLDNNQNPLFYEILTSEEKNTHFSFDCDKDTYKITITASGKNTPLVTCKFIFGCTNKSEGRVKLWFRKITSRPISPVLLVRGRVPALMISRCLTYRPGRFSFNKGKGVINEFH